MKISTLTLMAASTLVHGQITTWGNGTVACVRPGGSFCLGNPFVTDYIVKCTDKGVAEVSSCCNILAAKFPIGGAATCWQTSPNSGDAVCEKNCIAYCGSNKSVLPSQQCTPTATQTPTGATTPCPPGVATVPHAPSEPSVLVPGIQGKPTAPGASSVPINTPPAVPGQPGIPTSPVPGVPGESPVPSPVDPTVVPSVPTVSVPGDVVPTGTATGSLDVPPSVATTPEVTGPPMVPTAGASTVKKSDAAMAFAGLAAIFVL